MNIRAKKRKHIDNAYHSFDLDKWLRTSTKKIFRQYYKGASNA